MNYTEQEWIDLMRSDPKNAGYMLLFADWLTENGRELEGEAMRLLGETGRVGRWMGFEAVSNGYYSNRLNWESKYEVPLSWYLLKKRVLPAAEIYDLHPVIMRMQLVKVYADSATPEQRDEWQRELRGVEVA